MDNNFEERLKNIEDRNKKVELDKKWEQSFARIFSISIMTYMFIVITLFIIDAPKPFLNSLIPVFGFLLSTQSLPFIKKMWMKNK